MAKEQFTPKTFFLNETHELTPSEKSGGGRLPQYEGISWAAKATRISESLRTVATEVEESNDPLREERYFVLTLPVSKVKKRSSNKKIAPEGTFEEATHFGAEHSRVFDRLGLDLLQVTDDGRAIVHAEKGKFEQILHRTESLDSLGQREQARWATIDAFETIPLELRIDSEWLQHLHGNDAADIIIELQPVLSSGDADRVLRAIADLLLQRPTEKLTGTGTDFSGRHWFRGKASRNSIRKIAKDFFSVQSIHSPLFSIAAAKSSIRTNSVSKPQAPLVPPDTSSMPCVAVVDLGIPSGHGQLGPYRRGQFYAQNAPQGSLGNHGSFVASRVVFGDCQTHDELLRATGQCTYFDAVVGLPPVVNPGLDHVDDKLIMPAMQGVRGASPDVRVFNLSIGDYRSLKELPEVERLEKLRLLRDLDNFIFANDCIVVVAAGNSLAGVVPSQPYPDHYVDDHWALGPWACGYNTIVCGAFVSQLSANGLVQNLGWPSPFTRIGPGICGAPVPSFSAEGGNTDATYHFAPGLGVWTLSSAGLPEDHIGSSFAAPILAREAALTLHELQKFCVPGTQPFGVTARAFLTLTANRPVWDEPVKKLAERTLGYGKPSCQRLITPASGSAVMLWQGYIESPRDTVRVQIPIPLDWLNEAEKPFLRLVVCSDPPVNEAFQGGWVCRRIRPVLHPGPDIKAIQAPRGAHATYPVLDRLYSLEHYKSGQDKAAVGDLWLVEISYEEIAPYIPARDFDPRQRVAFAAEVIDMGESPVDPQSAMQSLPIAPTMNRLSIQPVPIRSPIIIKTSR